MMFMDATFGRTNREYPRIWLAPQQPRAGTPEDLAQAVIEAGTVVDPSSSYPLWGHLLRGSGVPLMASVGLEAERAVDQEHSANLIQASILAILSSLGTDHLEFLFFTVRRGLEEHQINGVLESFELARQDGLVSFFGLRADGPGLAVLGVWQFHDAFEALLLPRHPGTDAYETLAPLARARRTAVCVCSPISWGTEAPIAQRAEVVEAAHPHDAGSSLIAWQARDHAALVGVRSPEEVRRALAWEDALPSADRAYGAAEALLR
jgi:hypothetical protein